MDDLKLSWYFIYASRCSIGQPYPITAANVSSSIYTANDAYVRGLNLFVPADCVACGQEAYKQEAQAEMLQKG